MRTILLVALLLPCACREQEPPAPSAEQSVQLDDAEAMLNELASNEKGPEQSPGPSNSSD